MSKERIELANKVSTKKYTRTTKEQKRAYIEFIHRPDIIKELENVRKPKRIKYLAKRFEEESGIKITEYIMYCWNKVPLEPSIYIDQSKVKPKHRSDSDIEN